MPDTDCNMQTPADFSGAPSMTRGGKGGDVRGGDRGGIGKRANRSS